MGKNRFLDEVLSDVKQYYDNNKIVGGGKSKSKSRQDLYLQFSNLMAGVAKLFPSDMDLTTPIAVAIAAANSSSAIPSSPAASVSVAIAAANSSNVIPPSAAASVSVAIAAANSSNGSSTANSSNGSPIGSPNGSPTVKSTSDTNNIIEKAKLISENLKQLLEKFLSDTKAEQGDPDVETGELILGEQGKPNAVLISKEGTSYKQGFTNEDIVFRK